MNDTRKTPRVTLIFGILFLAVGIAVFGIRLIHAGPYSMPHGGAVWGALGAIVLGGLLLVWLMRLLVLLVEVSPLPTQLKASAMRFAPVVELTIAVAYVTSALYELLAEEPDFAWTLIALMAALAAYPIAACRRIGGDQGTDTKIGPSDGLWAHPL